MWQVVEKLVSGAVAGYFERVQSRVLGNIKRLQNAFRSRGLPALEQFNNFVLIWLDRSARNGARCSISRCPNALRVSRLC
jgi:hypothetical protein